MSYPRQKDPNKCPEIVPTSGLRMNYHQCNGKVVKDGYCRIHHPDAVKARQAESQRKYDEKWENSDFMKLKAELGRNADLERKLAACRTTLESITHDMGASQTIHNLCAETLELTKP